MHNHHQQRTQTVGTVHRPDLVVRVTSPDGKYRDVLNEEAYSVILTLARAFREMRKPFRIAPGQPVTAQTPSGTYRYETLTATATATTGGPLKLHAKEGDCGCAFRWLTGGRNA